MSLASSTTSLPSAEIGRVPYISETTVKTHGCSPTKPGGSSERSTNSFPYGGAVTGY
jgi:hypothetical protein